jgi:predicted transposase YbfD/YdcC
VLREIAWLDGGRRFPGELRLPSVACLVRAETRVEREGRSRSETRYFVSSRALEPAEAAAAVRGHWAIENRLHWVLDVTFADDLSRLRKGHGAHNMATVRHFALNLVRVASDRRSIKSRRKLAGWSTDYLRNLLSSASASLGFGTLRESGYTLVNLGLIINVAGPAVPIGPSAAAARRRQPPRPRRRCQASRLSSG